MTQLASQSLDESADETTRPGSGDPWHLSDCQPLDPVELAAAIEAFKATGDTDACNRVIQSHLRLVAKIARRYTSSLVSIDDLMAEGALALRRALHNFDQSHGASFTSYASVVVEHAVRAGAQSQREQFRIPARDRRRAAVRQRTIGDFFARFGRPPAQHEVAELDRQSGQPQVTRGTFPAPGPSISIDNDSGSGAGAGAGLSDDKPSPLENVSALDERSRLQAAVETLPGVVGAAIRLRFGFGGVAPLGSTEIAQKLGVPRPTVEKSIAEALRLLRVALSETPVEGGSNGTVRVPKIPSS